MSLKPLLLTAAMILTGGLNVSALECAGTEPFWGATLTQDQLVLTMAGQQPQTMPLTSLTGAWGISPEYIKVYSDQRGPVAVVQQVSCSDGMSEIEYPSQITLFGGNFTLFGCCK